MPTIARPCPCCLPSERLISPWATIPRTIAPMPAIPQKKQTVPNTPTTTESSAVAFRRELGSGVIGEEYSFSPMTPGFSFSLREELAGEAG
jgi:hypothetical protein